MATNTEQIDALDKASAAQDKLTTVHTLRLDNLDGQVKDVHDAQSDMKDKVAELRLKHETEIKLLRSEVDELKAARKELSERFWKFAIPLAVAVVASLVVAIIGLKR